MVNEIKNNPTRITFAYFKYIKRLVFSEYLNSGVKPLTVKLLHFLPQQMQGGVDLLDPALFATTGKKRHAPKQLAREEVVREADVPVVLEMIKPRDQPVQAPPSLAPVAEAASVEKPAQVQDGSILNDHNVQEHAKEDQVMNNEEQISEDSQVQENLTHVNQINNGSDSNIDVNLDDQSRAVP
jgi:hypothetical protein